MKHHSCQKICTSSKINLLLCRYGILAQYFYNIIRLNTNTVMYLRRVMLLKPQQDASNKHSMVSCEAPISNTGTVDPSTTFPRVKHCNRGLLMAQLLPPADRPYRGREFSSGDDELAIYLFKHLEYTLNEIDRHQVNYFKEMTITGHSILV